MASGQAGPPAVLAPAVHHAGLDSGETVGEHLSLTLRLELGHVHPCAGTRADQLVHVHGGRAALLAHGGVQGCPTRMPHHGYRQKVGWGHRARELRTVKHPLEHVVAGPVLLVLALVPFRPDVTIARSALDRRRLLRRQLVIRQLVVRRRIVFRV
eukprot:2011233-Prymnesium_polylepis.1